MSETPYPPPPPPPLPPQPGFGETYAVRTGLATTALVLGILGIPTVCVCIGPLLGLIAIVVGSVALMKISSEPALYGGRGRAIGGIVTGGVSLVLTAVLSLALPAMILAAAAAGFGIAPAAVNLENVGQALQAYHTEHGSYPPNLAVLRDEGAIANNPLDPTGDPTREITYFPGVDANDPPHWIQAYLPTNLFSLEFYGVVYADGSTDMLEKPEFEKAMARFGQEYDAKHGAPPDALLPAPTAT